MNSRLAFKITCLSCGAETILDNSVVKVGDMRDIKVYQTQDIANIDCICGNEIACEWD